jgi:hypothetical protein
VPTTTCTRCSRVYEERSEEEANAPGRLCLDCYFGRCAVCHRNPNAPPPAPSRRGTRWRDVSAHLRACSDECEDKMSVEYRVATSVQDAVFRSLKPGAYSRGCNHSHVGSFDVCLDDIAGEYASLGGPYKVVASCPTEEACDAAYRLLNWRPT